MVFNEELEFVRIREQPCDSRMQLFHTSQHLQTHRDPICCASVMIEWMLGNRCAEVETALLAWLSGSQGQLVELCSGDTVSKLMFASVLHCCHFCLGGRRVQGVGWWVYLEKSSYSTCNFTLLVYSHWPYSVFSSSAHYQRSAKQMTGTVSS